MGLKTNSNPKCQVLTKFPFSGGGSTQINSNPKCQVLNKFHIWLGGGGTSDQLNSKVPSPDQISIGGEGTLDQLKSKVSSPDKISKFPLTKGGGRLQTNSNLMCQVLTKFPLGGVDSRPTQIQKCQVLPKFPFSRRGGGGTPDQHSSNT